MELLTVDETAQLLKVSTVTVRRFIARGDLRSVKIGRQRRIERQDVEQFVHGATGTTDDLPEELRNARPLAPDDSIFEIIGMARSERPGDVASDKHRYLADAYLETHDGR